jgi:hypothetical protein
LLLLLLLLAAGRALAGWLRWMEMPRILFFFWCEFCLLWWVVVVVAAVVAAAVVVAVVVVAVSVVAAGGGWRWYYWCQQCEARRAQKRGRGRAQMLTIDARGAKSPQSRARDTMITLLQQQQ